MSTVVDPNAPVTPAGSGWILDEPEPRERQWALDEPPAEPVAPPPPPGTPPQAPAATAPAPGNLPGQGYEYKTETGHIFRGGSPEEVLKQMEQAVMRSGNMALSAQQQLEQARREMGGQTSYDRGGSRQTEPERPAFDPKRYYELLADTKPLEANEYLLQHIFGVDNVREAFTEAYTTAQQVRDRFEMADFLTNNPDFPATPQSAEAILMRVDRAGVEPTRWNLEVAKNQLYNEGFLRPMASASAPAPQPTAAAAPPPPSRGAGAPPSPRTTTAADPNDRELSEAELFALPIEKHREYLVRRGRL